MTPQQAWARGFDDLRFDQLRIVRPKEDDTGKGVTPSFLVVGGRPKDLHGMLVVPPVQRPLCRQRDDPSRLGGTGVLPGDEHESQKRRGRDPMHCFSPCLRVQRLPQASRSDSTAPGMSRSAHRQLGDVGVGPRPSAVKNAQQAVAAQQIGAMCMSRVATQLEFTDRPGPKKFSGVGS
jgi:hypothetical protein